MESLRTGHIQQTCCDALYMDINLCGDIPHVRQSLIWTKSDDWLFAFRVFTHQRILRISTCGVMCMSSSCGQPVHPVKTDISCFTHCIALTVASNGNNNSLYAGYTNTACFKNGEKNLTELFPDFQWNFLKCSIKLFLRQFVYVVQFTLLHGINAYSCNSTLSFLLQLVLYTILQSD